MTGASGSLGSALATHDAREGVIMHLWGRREDRLRATCDAVQSAGAITRPTSFDLTDVHGAVDKLLEQDVEARFDLAYLVAGIGDTRAPGALVEEPEAVIRASLVNFAAPAAMASALAERMAERGRGRIVLVGSAAAHHSLPFAASYAGSKAGLSRFADALRISMKPHGVGITLVSPGFIDTSADREHGSNRPFEMPVEAAARRIARASQRGEADCVFPWQFALLKAVSAVLPARLRERILARLET